MRKKMLTLDQDYDDRTRSISRNEAHAEARGGAVNQSKVSLTSDDCWSCARASRARKMFTCFNDTSAAPSASEACIRKDQHNYLAATWYAEYDCPPTIGMAPASTARNTLYR